MPLDNTFLAIISFFIVLIPLVIIHELGHFFAGKSVGITILEFGVGIPPRAVTLFTKGDTIYTLNWLPLGGFVRPYGEDFVRPKNQEELQADLQEIEGRHIENPKSVFEAGPWERLWFFVAGPLANFIAAVGIFIIIGIVGRPVLVDAGVAVDAVFEDSVAADAGMEKDDFITHVNGTEIKTQEEFLSSFTGAEPVTFTIVRDDGDPFDVTLTPELSLGEEEVTRVIVIEVQAGTPADEADLKPNDIFLAVDGVPVYTTDDLIAATKDREGDRVTYTIRRDNEVFDKVITPRRIDTEERAKLGVAISAFNENLGFATQQAVEREYHPADNLFEAVDYGVSSFGEAMNLMVQAPILLIRGVLPLEQARPVSPVGIAQIGGQVLRESQESNSLFPILSFGALISIALAVTNLLPIPGLDGGRMLFVFIELLRGKPMEPEREGFVHMIGLLLLLSVMLVVVMFDIIDPIDVGL